MSTSLPDGRRLILGSSSVFRRELLDKLGLPFECCSPDTDETALDEETAPELVQRLAQAKTVSVANQEPGSLVIGSDQVAVLNGKILGKPGNHENAVAQLQAASGREVTFYTGLCLLDSESRRTQICVEPFSVQFRKLSESQINAYLRREQPYNCSGSFKSEALGIALFQYLRGDDPNSLIGLPLIRLVDMLGTEGVSVL